MNKKMLIAIISAVTIVIVILVFLFIGLSKNNDKENEKNDKDYIIANMAELFPDKEVTQKFEDNTGEYEVTFKEPTSKDGLTTIVTEYDTKINDKVFTVQMNYEISDNKITESGKYISDGDVVSIIYPSEIVLGVPYKGMIWKSSDGFVTNTVTSMANNRVTIESISKLDFYEDGEKAPTKKDYKITRVYEKGKGIILYRTEIVDSETSVYERKIVE